MRLRAVLATAILAGGAALGMGLATAEAQEFAIPAPIAAGHEELYSQMQAATEKGGDLGDAARAAMEALGPHFQKEEEYALPQLGLLPALVGPPLGEQADLSPEQREELASRTERFRQELPQMIEEHRQIEASLDDLRAAAEAAGDTELARLAEEIGVHARTEEMVLYPTALLIGDYVALKAASSNE